MTFAQKEIAKLKNQLNQAKENLARERAEHSSKGKKENSQDDEVGSKRVCQSTSKACQGIETGTFTIESTTEGIQNTSDM